MCLALRASGLWLRYTMLQNLPSGNLGPDHPVGHTPKEGLPRVPIFEKANNERTNGKNAFLHSFRRNVVVDVIRPFRVKRRQHAIT